LLFRERYDDDPNVRSLKFFGQEILASTYAMANMNVFIHNMEAEIALGDTMNLPKFLDERGGLKKFDIVVSNPCGTRIFQKAHMRMTPLVGSLSAFLRPARLIGAGFSTCMLHSGRTVEWR